MPSTVSTELARKGQACYESRLKSHLEANHLHEFVAIDPDSGEYFLGITLSAAIEAARRVHADRLFYVIRIGQTAAVQIG